MTYRKSADPKIALKGTLTCPVRYIVQNLPVHFIDVQGDKNTSADKKSGPLVSSFLDHG